MRVAVQRVLRQADLLDELGGALAPLALRADPLDAQRLGDDVGDRHARIERRERILEDDLDGAPGERLCRRSRRSACRASAPRRRSGVRKPATTWPSVVLPEPDLADERQRLALGDRGRDIVDGAQARAPLGANKPLALREGDADLLDGEKRRHGAQPRALKQAARWPGSISTSARLGRCGSRHRRAGSDRRSGSRAIAASGLGTPPGITGRRATRRDGSGKVAISPRV